MVPLYVGLEITYVPLNYHYFLTKDNGAYGWICQNSSGQTFVHVSSHHFAATKSGLPLEQPKYIKPFMWQDQAR